MGREGYVIALFMYTNTTEPSSEVILPSQPGKQAVLVGLTKN